MRQVAGLFDVGCVDGIVFDEVHGVVSTVLHGRIGVQSAREGRRHPRLRCRERRRITHLRHELRLLGEQLSENRRTFVEFHFRIFVCVVVFVPRFVIALPHTNFSVTICHRPSSIRKQLAFRAQIDHQDIRFVIVEKLLYAKTDGFPRIARIRLQTIERPAVNTHALSCLDILKIHPPVAHSVRGVVKAQVELRARHQDHCAALTGNDARVPPFLGIHGRGALHERNGEFVVPGGLRLLPVNRQVVAVRKVRKADRGLDSRAGIQHVGDIEVHVLIHRILVGGHKNAIRPIGRNRIQVREGLLQDRHSLLHEIVHDRVRRRPRGWRNVLVLRLHAKVIQRESEFLRVRVHALAFAELRKNRRRVKDARFIVVRIRREPGLVLVRQRPELALLP